MNARIQIKRLFAFFVLQIERKTATYETHHEFNILKNRIIVLENIYNIYICNGTNVKYLTIVIVMRKGMAKQTA